jgi:hypothetical protein
MPSDKRLYVFRTIPDPDKPHDIHTDWITDDFGECLRRLNEVVAKVGEDHVDESDGTCEVMAYDPQSKVYRHEDYMLFSTSQISESEFTCENREDIASMLLNGPDSVQIRFHIHVHVLDRTIDRHVTTSFSILNKRENDQCDVLCNGILAKDKLNPRFYIRHYNDLHPDLPQDNGADIAVDAILSNYTDILVRDTIREIRKTS